MHNLQQLQQLHNLWPCDNSCLWCILISAPKHPPKQYNPWPDYYLHTIMMSSQYSSLLLPKLWPSDKCKLHKKVICDCINSQISGQMGAISDEVTIMFTCLACDVAMLLDRYLWPLMLRVGGSSCFSRVFDLLICWYQHLKWPKRSYSYQMVDWSNVRGSGVEKASKNDRVNPICTCILMKVL